MILQNVNNLGKYKYINSMMNADGKVFLLVESILTSTVLLLPFDHSKWVVVEEDS